MGITEKAIAAPATVATPKNKRAPRCDASVWSGPDGAAWTLLVVPPPPAPLTPLDPLELDELPEELLEPDYDPPDPDDDDDAVSAPPALTGCG